MTSLKSSQSPCCKRRALLVGLHFVSFALLCSPNGITWYFGNLAVYLDSYWYEQQGSVNLTQWVISTFIIAWSLGINVGAKLVKLMDPRIVACLGVLLFDAGTFLSYWSVQYWQPLFLFTYPVMSGLAVGILSAEIYTRISRLVEKKAGIAFAILSNYMNVGSLAINYIITWYINPTNVEANFPIKSGKLKIFTERSVTSRVPFVFIVLGLVSSAIHATGVGLTIILNKKGEFQKGQAPKSCLTDAKGAESHELSASPSKAIQSGTERGQKTDPNGMISKLDEEKRIGADSCCNKISTNKSGLLPQCPKRNKKEIIDENEKNQADSHHGDLEPLQIIKIFTFWLLLLSIIANDTSYVVHLNFYKLFGQLWIHDDHFLTQLGMATVFTASLARLAWASIVNEFGIKRTQIILNSCMSITFAFYYFTPQINNWLYAIVTCFTAALSSYVGVIFPVIVLRLFGTKHFAANYGLVMMSTVILNFVAAPTVQAVLLYLGWPAIYLGTAALNTLSLSANVLWFPSRC